MPKIDQRKIGSFLKCNTRFRQIIKNIDRAVQILKNSGCAEVYLFGSLARGNMRHHSDIDLAVKGCPAEKYFELLGQLLFELDYPVDLVDLENENPFGQHLEKKRDLLKIG